MSVAYVEHVAGATVLSTNEHEPPLNHQHLPNHHHQRSLKESLFSVIAPSSNSTCFEKVGGEDPLACWLRNLKVLIPDESFQKGLFSLVSFDVSQMLKDGGGVGGDALSGTVESFWLTRSLFRLFLSFLSFLFFSYIYA